MWAVEPVLVAVAGLFVVAGVVLAYVAHRARAALGARWPTTPGTILTASIHVQRTGASRREVPVVRYAYRVGDEAFQGSRIRLREDDRTAPVAARHVLARYPVGANVQVFYDPADPGRSALER